MEYSVRSRIRQWLPVALVFILLVISLNLLNLATYNTKKTDYFSERQLYLNIIILVILSTVIIVNLIRAFYQWRTRQAGSRFTLKIMSGFIILTLLPALVIAFFSINFLGSRIDGWFERSVEGALDDSVELSQLSLAIRTRQHLTELGRLRNSLNNKSKLEISESLERFREETGAHEVMLLTEEQRIYAMSVADTDTLIPLFPARDLFRAFSGQNDAYAHLEPVGQDSLFSRVAWSVKYGLEGNTGILTALFPISEREQELSRSVESVRSEYKNLSFQRNQFKDAFRITLLMIMVLTTLFSIWAAFVFSRRLTQPVRVLVEGTLAVASGNLDKKIPVSQQDDFNLLSTSFNNMTQRLSEAQKEREIARQQLQQEHDYLNVVLEHLSSGVITLDNEGIIRRMNTTAANILKVNIKGWVGNTLGNAIEQYPHLRIFQDAFSLKLAQIEQSPANEWQTEISIEQQHKRLLLVCRGAILPIDHYGQRGVVLVFDDVSDLIQAEHDAAWGEVARRLAHEIKNPLTPIQLSAERLVRKLEKELSEDSAQFLKRMTQTIIQQVDNLKSMVNAFSDYAKTPAVNLQLADLNNLVQDTAELYRANEKQAEIQLLLTSHLPKLRLDTNRIRQLLINLIKNALEALEDSNIKGCITLQTIVHANYVQLTIADNGPGIPTELLPRLFEPYVTSKHKGTGLGLAIVKKIVEEHSGSISAHNNPEKGAMISIQFPLLADAK